MPELPSSLRVLYVQSDWSGPNNINNHGLPPCKEDTALDEAKEDTVLDEAVDTVLEPIFQTILAVEDGVDVALDAYNQGGIDGLVDHLSDKLSSSPGNRISTPDASTSLTLWPPSAQTSTSHSPPSPTPSTPPQPTTPTPIHVTSHSGAVSTTHNSVTSTTTSPLTAATGPSPQA